MKQFLKELLIKLCLDMGFVYPEEAQIDVPKLAEHGDYASNLALQLAKSLKQNPRKLAQELVQRLQQQNDYFSKIEIAGPGFINFFLTPKACHQALKIFYFQRTLQLPKDGNNQRALVEFVSANPTGPLHIGHARNAVVGDVLSRVLSAVGYQVSKEFYINDHGVQIQTLGKSALYYLQLKQGIQPGEELSENVYRGEYLEKLVEKHFSELQAMQGDLTQMGKLLSIDLLEIIKQTLAKLDVVFDEYFSESSLYATGAVTESLTALKVAGHCYEADGALWFRSTVLGDDKDRVLIKQDGTYTYLTPDIAYHRNKFLRNYDLYINVLGADHGGYLQRIHAAIEAMGFDKNKLKFLLMQLVSLYQGDELKRMSKRQGTVVSLEEVVDSVGSDAARFFLIMRSHNVTLDFDLDLAKKQSQENPVFYLQYAHARLSSILAKAKTEGYLPEQWLSADLSSMDLPEELALIRQMLAFNETLQDAASLLEPHRLSFYLLDLAKSFQAYYTKGKGEDRYRVITSDRVITLAKLYLCEVLQTVLAKGLNILGVSAPDSM